MPSLVIDAAGLTLRCPNCHIRVTEHFDSGTMICGECGQSWPLAAIVDRVSTANDLLRELLGLLQDEACGRAQAPD